MALRDWRLRNRLSLPQAAERLGASSWQMVWKWEHRKQVPRPQQLVRIYLATAGEVDPNSFYALPDLPARAAA